MKLRVLFFSVLRDITSQEEIAVTLPAEATVTTLLQELYRRWPKLQEWEPSLLIAIDQTYARREDPLPEGAEVAIMPPVQGG
jgi:molybdopterin synthase sulfur carrier subunit